MYFISNWELELTISTSDDLVEWTVDCLNLLKYEKVSWSSVKYEHNESLLE